MPGAKKGLDLIKAVAQYTAKGDGFDKFISKVNFVSAGKGNIVAELKLAPEHLNGGGGLHGGCTATLIDSITTLGLMTHDKNDLPGVSVDIHVSYLKGAKAGEEIVIEGKTVKAGANLAFLECIIKHKKDDSVIATATHTKFIGGGSRK